MKNIGKLCDRAINSCRGLVQIVAVLIAVSPNALAFQEGNPMVFPIDLIFEKTHRVKSGFYLVPVSKDGNICNAFDTFEKKNTKSTIHSFLKGALLNLHSQGLAVDSFETLYGIPVSREHKYSLDLLEMEAMEYSIDGSVGGYLLQPLIEKCTAYRNLSEDECADEILVSSLSNIDPKNGYYTSKFSITGEFSQESEQVALLYLDSKNRKDFSCSLDGDGLIVSYLQKPYLHMSVEIKFDFQCHDLNNRKQTFSPEITKSQLESFGEILSTTVLNGMSDFSKVDIPDPTMDIGTLDGGKTNKLTCSSEGAYGSAR